MTLGFGVLLLFYTVLIIFALYNWDAAKLLAKLLVYGTVAYAAVLAVMHVYKCITNHHAELTRKRTETQNLAYFPAIPQKCLALSQKHTLRAFCGL